ncbi:ABC-2 type transport system ATP-binding protein [Marihabitans asiaticum]|uniref:ABC-2 type transport system ATP-binding protein n=2 Tax=Marihabitans asiaticum TaxID=415218 RepID=A0A560W8F7_9MICO|nr:ABC-2 type transport system ATP-binding protein [Marihabitans asiaticum]
MWRMSTSAGARHTGSRLEISNLSKKFGGFTAVDDLTFTVEPGRVTGFLGPNGAGKTTTLRMLLGLVNPTSGSATIGGRRYRDLDNPLGTVGAALEATNFHPGRSGRNHLRVMAAAAGLPNSRVDELLDLVGIPAAAKKRAGGYSMGMRQRLGLAAALLGDPEVLILDEPANGLDPEGIRWLRGFLTHLAGEGRTVLVSSHMLTEVQQTADEVVIIANGRMVRSGTVAELQGTPRAFVRTSDPDTLVGALRVADVTAETTEGGLLVETDDLRVVGDVALRAGLPIWELTRKAADLEQLFFDLTDGTNRNYTGAPAGDPGGPAPAERDAITGQEGANL